MPNEEITFVIIKINDETETFRLVCTKDRQVVDIIESNFRRCLNRQMELLREHSYTKEDWRIRRD